MTFIPCLRGNIGSLLQEAEEFFTSCSSATALKEISSGFNNSYLLRHRNCDPLVQRNSVFLGKTLSRLLDRKRELQGICSFTQPPTTLRKHSSRSTRIARNTHPENFMAALLSG
jgi:hypothetical protein